MLTTNPVRDALISCRPTLGSWIQIGHPICGEILSYAGFDWLAIDCEHSDIDIAQVVSLMRGMSKTSTVPIVRVGENDTLQIRRVLDAGARGVIVPMINTAEQAKKAVAAAKYPPQGIRGFGFSRANEYGSIFEEYIKAANNDILVVAQIEHIDGIDNLDEILNVEGIDGVFVGPYDLSGSLDIPGQLDDPRVKEAVRKLRTLCKEAGKSAGLHVVAPDEDKIRLALQEGFTFVALSVDTLFMKKSAVTCLEAARAQIKNLTERL